ncbi:PAH-inducible cytochrome P450 monooxygenase PC-PAH 4 [Trametes coccinea BRFM310]|uniref:PAH-inducible cytochrome P450 monooxygenase PC-PAH 4 n=1 Tax=Trametes coccinea (strain BRFM310) TaxID=1353009 RepID=A0A1Y2IL33_TRAC3|nr:PAH-inducible cytochrome P450 monooxygenase PC-PAH 4 [Trametes coccinea BRFM310]
MFLSVIAAIVVAGCLLISLIRSRRRNTIRSLRGPRMRSLLLGYEYEISRQDEVGDLESKWLREYGPTWRVSGSFARDVLMTADPKALQHIYHKSGYSYAKQPAQVNLGYLMSGPNIVWAQGIDHQRHRKIMNPAFSSAQLRSFLPLFQSTAYKLVDRWKSELASAPTLETKVNTWLSRVTLDIVGEAAFDYDYKALDEAEDSALAKAYHGILYGIACIPTRVMALTGLSFSSKEAGYRLPKATLLFRAAWDYLPFPIIKLFKYAPTKPFPHIRHVREVYMEYGKQILREKRPEVDTEKRAHSKDILSILLKANASSDEKTRLTEEEILAQMYTLTLAGHETTATTLSFLLYELARHPEYQARMRQEILEARAQASARGKSDFTWEELDGMTLCTNAIKDDVLPLAYPIMTADGSMVSEIPLRKGQIVNTSFAMYNRLPQVWGADAEEWNPDRFAAIDGNKQTYVGVFANLMTFSAGTRACIGWRFAIIEMQVLVAELVSTFKFEMPETAKAGETEVRRAPTGNALIPLIRGKPELGPALRLRVSLAD